MLVVIVLITKVLILIQLSFRMSTRKRKNSDSEEASSDDFREGCFSDIDMTAETSDIKRDRGSIALLVFLYVLQGIPLGLAGSIPYLLQSRNVNYKDQAIFSFVYWPFSIKLLWAPIVDAVFVSSFGRRKTWLVPVQYLIGK